MAFSGAQITRLGVAGIPRHLYGSFAAKSQSQQLQPLVPSVAGGRIMSEPGRPLRRLRRIEQEIAARIAREAAEPPPPDVGNVVSLDRMRALKGDADTSGLPTLQQLSVERIGEIISEPTGLETVLRALIEQQQQNQVRQAALEAQQTALETLADRVRLLTADVEALTGFVMVALAEENGTVIVNAPKQVKK